MSNEGAKIAITQVSEIIKQRIKADKAQFKASDNISKYVYDNELPVLVEEVKWKFQKVLDSLIIDTENDPNSKDTAKRLAKMYVYELMSGRYEPMPDVTSFPNEGENRFEGMLVVRAEIRYVFTSPSAC